MQNNDVHNQLKLTPRQKAAAFFDGSVQTTGAAAGVQVPVLFVGLAAEVSKNADFAWAKNYLASPVSFATFSALEYAKAVSIAINAILKGKITGGEALACLNGILAGTGGLVVALGKIGGPACFFGAFLTGFVGDVGKFIEAYGKGDKLEMAKQGTFAIADLGCAAMVGVSLGVFAELGAIPLLAAAGASAVKGVWNAVDTVKSTGSRFWHWCTSKKATEETKALLPTATTPAVNNGK
jgi:hypothetical protein